MAETNLMLAAMYADQGRFEEALKAIDSAETQLQERSNRIRAQVSLTRSEILLTIGDTEGSATELERAKASLDSNMTHEQLFLAFVRTQLAFASQNATNLQHQLGELAEKTDRPDMKELNGTVRIELGRSLLRQRRNTQAITTLNSVRELANEDRLRPIHAAATLALSEAYFAEGMLAPARECALESAELAAVFEGRLIVAQANALLAKIADASANFSERDAYNEKAIALARAIVAQIPPSLKEKFVSRHGWADTPTVISNGEVPPTQN
jgi:tetratricopeptide (TPR) repeat protein